MCGIVGLFLKEPKLEPELGHMLSEMLVTMTDRGPDSAGIAVYRDDDADEGKITVQSANSEADFENLGQKVGANVRVIDTHAIISCPKVELDEVLTKVRSRPELRIMSSGSAIEIYKEVGVPQSVADRFDIPTLQGSHGIGHTRMATESAVTTLGAHPFSTAADQCLVHNGSLSNHNSLRRKLGRMGVSVETENDTEVAAAYLSWKMQEGLIWEKHWKPGSKTLMDFILLLSAPGTGLAYCAILLRASRRFGRDR